MGYWKGILETKSDIIKVRDNCIRFPREMRLIQAGSRDFSAIEIDEKQLKKTRCRNLILRFDKSWFHDCRETNMTDSPTSGVKVEFDAQKLKEALVTTVKAASDVWKPVNVFLVFEGRDLYGGAHAYVAQTLGWIAFDLSPPSHKSFREIDDKDRSAVFAKRLKPILSYHHKNPEEKLEEIASPNKAINCNDL